MTPTLPARNCSSLSTKRMENISISKDSEKEAINNLKEMFRKFPKHFNKLERDFKKYNSKGDKEDDKKFRINAS